jgi:glutamyl-tRNA reductase
MADCERLSAETRLDPMLMVIGLNHRTAPVEVRERFWISESRRFEALSQLRSAEGVDEIIVLATCNRTEFLLWASEPTLAENSVLRFLTAQYGLKLCEWKRFYRLIDEAALLHIFRVGSGLDSMVPGEPQIVSQLNNALAAGGEVWQHGTIPGGRRTKGADGFEAGPERDRHQKVG